MVMEQTSSIISLKLFNVYLKNIKFHNLLIRMANVLGIVFLFATVDLWGILLGVRCTFRIVWVQMSEVNNDLCVHEAQQGLVVILFHRANGKFLVRL